MEALEDEGQLILRDADARVRNLKRNPVTVLAHTYRDVAALGRVAHGVVQEYGGSLEGAVPIEGGLDLSFREDAFDGHLSDASPAKAQQITNTVGVVASERISTLPISTHDITATVVEKATLPTTPEEPDQLRNGVLAVVLGTMLGTMLAFGLVFLMEMRSK